MLKIYNPLYKYLVNVQILYSKQFGLQKNYWLHEINYHNLGVFQTFDTVKCKVLVGTLRSKALKKQTLTDSETIL